MSEYPRGRFCWMDLMTSDPKAAEQFYTTIAGWGTQPWEGGEMPYTMFTKGEVALGGVMELPEQARSMGAPNHWLAYIAVPDVEATAAKTAELGGNILKDTTEIPSAGKFAVLADPQGAVFAVFNHESEAPGSDDPPTPGDFSWHELATSNHEAAFDFYAELFGWEKTDAMDMGPMGIYQMYGRGGPPLGGMFNKPDEMPVSAWLHYIMVPDVNEAVQTVQKLGGQILNGPMEVPGGDVVAQCIDPQGAAFAIHSTGGGQS